MARLKKNNAAGSGASKPQPVKAGRVSGEDIELKDAGASNEYAAHMEQGHKVDRRWQRVFITGVVLIAVFCFGLIIPKDLLNQGVHYAGYNQGYSFSWFVQDLQQNVTGIMALFTGSYGLNSTTAAQIFLYVVVALTGAGMAMSGAVYQGTFRNALVTPSALGVMGGSTLGLAVFVALFVSDDGSSAGSLQEIFSGAGHEGDLLGYLWASYGLAVCSFVGCLLVVGLVVLTVNAFNNGKFSGINMIITGQVVGAVCGGIVNIIRYYYLYTNPDGAKAYALQQLQIATFYRSFTLADVVAVGIPIAICFAVVMGLRHKMSVLTLSEDEQRSLGVSARGVQVLLVGMCTLVTAIIVSFCGHTGFIGFLAPHIARKLVGPNFKYLVPAAMLVGATFVLASYVLVQMTLGPEYENVCGLFISIFGAAVFLFYAIKTGGGERNEFK